MTPIRVTSLDYLKEITGGESEIMKEFILMFFEQLPEFRDGMAAQRGEVFAQLQVLEAQALRQLNRG